MSKINEKRTERMRKHNARELKRIADAGGLSSAAAEYEIRRRANKGIEPEKTS